MRKLEATVAEFNFLHQTAARISLSLANSTLPCYSLNSKRRLASIRMPFCPHGSLGRCNPLQTCHNANSRHRLRFFFPSLVYPNDAIFNFDEDVQLRVASFRQRVPYILKK